jgi:ABC-type sugar transport system substrate-binding protein
VHQVNRLGIALALLATMMFVAAGCGSKKSSSSTTSASSSSQTSSSNTPTAAVDCGKKSDSMPEPKLTGVTAIPGPKQQAAEAAGTKAGEALGKTDKLPKCLTIGYLQIIGGIESADKVANSTLLALQSLGYNIKYCDGKGDPQAWVTCGNSLLNQGVKAIFTNGIDSSSIAAVLRKAKAKGVPVIATAGTTPGYTGNYSPSDTKQGEVMVQYLNKRLGEVKGAKPIAVEKYPAPWAKAREDVLDAYLKSHPDVKVALQATADPTKLIESTKAAVSTWLTQKQDLRALWFSFDVAGQAGGQQAATKAGGKSFPARPLVVTFHAEPSTQQLIKQGAIDAVSDVNFDAASWIGVDQLAENLARGTSFSTEVAPKYPYIGDGYTYQIVDKSNLPTKGLYVETNTDVASFFKAKWKAEFGR